MTSDNIAPYLSNVATSIKQNRKIMTLKTFIISILIAITTTAIHATDSIAPKAMPQVSLITCYAGENVYELCGHTALRVQIGDYDMAVNYGMFDFDTPNFVYRFVSGQTDYFVAQYPFHHFCSEYQKEGRRIVEQKLNLTPQQVYNILYLLHHNLQPHNRYYRYNYVKNNCATLPIAIIESAIGQPISFGEPQIPGAKDWTFRDEMRYFHTNYPWYQFGIDLALGSGLDYKLSTKEKGFAPEALQQMLDNATITDSLGNVIRLVSQTIVLNEGKPSGAQLPATPWILSPMCLSILIFLFTLIFTIKDIHSHYISRWLDTTIFSIFALMGCVITFLVFKSTHEATSPNWLIVWLNPLCFIPAIGIWLKKCKSVIICYHFANFVALLLLIIAWNWTNQVANIAFWPLISCSLMRSGSYIYNSKCAKKTTA